MVRTGADQPGRARPTWEDCYLWVRNAPTDSHYVAWPREPSSPALRDSRSAKDARGAFGHDDVHEAAITRGVLRILLILVATELALYPLWRISAVIRLLGISVFLQKPRSSVRDAHRLTELLARLAGPHRPAAIALLLPLEEPGERCSGL